MNKSELVKKVVEMQIITEEEAIKLTKKMLLDLITVTEEDKAKAEIVEEVIAEEIVEEAIAEEIVEEVIAEEIVKEVISGVVAGKIVAGAVKEVEEAIIEDVVEEAIIEEVIPKSVIKPVRKQTRFKVNLKKDIPLVRIPTRLYETLVKGMDHKHVKDLENIFDNYGEFIIQDIDRVKKTSLVSFVNGKLVLK